MDRENIKRGSFLKQLRTSSRMSERDLAEMLDVETSDIAVWETGIKFPEDSATIEKLAKIFHVTKREILNGEYKKDKVVTEIEHDSKVYEDYTLSNTGKNILIITLSCVILLILFVTIFSVSKNVNKKVNKVDISQYYVSDDREVVTHSPKTVNESVVRNTVALNSNKVYNPERLLDYGFTKSGDKYTKSYTRHKIEYQNGKFYLYFKSNHYRETYVKDLSTDKIMLTVYSGSYSNTFEYDTYSIKDCSKYTCRYTNDYLNYINFLSVKIGE